MKKIIYIIFVFVLANFAYALCPAGMSGDGASNPCIITNCLQLQAMNQDLDANYALGGNIDCGETRNWNGGAGFEPIGDSSIPFTGQLNGRNYTVSNLFINRGATAEVGLFGKGGSAGIQITITNVGLLNANITGIGTVGGLVGYLVNGNITNSFINGTVRAYGNFLGGLVGRMDGGTILNSYVLVQVNQWLGVGNNNGGLIGAAMSSSIINCFAIGNLSGGGDKNGGLIGSLDFSTISNSFSNMSVSGVSKTGGLVGANDFGTIINSYYNNVSSPTVCVGSDSGTTTCTAIQNNFAYFQGDVSFDAPFSSWSFGCNGIWNEAANDYPHLAWEGVGGIIGTPMKGDGSVSNPYQITNCCELQLMNMDLTANYILMNNIDCTETKNWNEGKGFEPVGDNLAPFTGRLNGNEKVINDLYINRPSEDYVGLFGYTNMTLINDLGLKNIIISGLINTGGLVGENNGNLNNIYATGEVKSLIDDPTKHQSTGGIVGKLNLGILNNSYSYVNLVAHEDVGGLIGFNKDNILNSFSNGSITNQGIGAAGGLVGENYGNIYNSFTTSKVVGSFYYGGAVGSNGGTLTNIYWNNHADNPDNCYGGFVSGNTGCTPITDINYFKSDVNTDAPFSSWDFFTTWHEVQDDYPHLAWEGLGGEDITDYVNNNKRILAYYDFNDDSRDVINNNDAVVYNAVHIPNSKTTGDGSYYFDGQGDYISSFNNQYNLKSIKSISADSTTDNQQGIATDGTFIYVAGTNYLYKYNFNGNLISMSSPISLHMGGITIYNNKIYVVVSSCSEGTYNNYVYVYDLNLQKIQEYDINNDFDICPGAIAFYENNFYVAESYWDSLHKDKVVKYDQNFNNPNIYLLNHYCTLGIQGIEHINGQFQINCHNNQFYRINSTFEISSIKEGISPIDLQDLAVLNSTTSIYNDRQNRKILFVENNFYDVLDTSINDEEYTVSAWFKIKRKDNTIRSIFESAGSGAISAEISSNNLLKYSVQSEGSVALETNIFPEKNRWHHIVITYKKDDYSKIYYQGIELSDYQGNPTGNLSPITGFNIGAYRNANDRWFYGEIDEIKIYNYVLSSEEILAEYNNNKPNCINHSSNQCYDNDVYYFNSCNEIEDKKTECGNGICSNGNCIYPATEFAWFMNGNSLVVSKMATTFQGIWDILRYDSITKKYYEQKIKFGTSSDKPIQADYDGDGITDIAILNNKGKIIIKTSSGIVINPSFTASQSWRTAIADYDGDKKADFAWFDQNTARWIIYKSSTNYKLTMPNPVFGDPNSIPVPADYDGDGKADIAINNYGRSGRIAYKSSKDGKTYATVIGNPNWRAAVADYDGDNKADFAWFEPSTGNWKILQSSMNNAELLPNPRFGYASSTPVPADYDGDGKVDIAVYNYQKSGQFAFKSLATGLVSATPINYPRGKPVVGNYDGK